MGACAARQYSDQMMCGECGLAWDVNDPDPPECNRGKKAAPPVYPGRLALEAAVADITFLHEMRMAIPPSSAISRGVRSHERVSIPLQALSDTMAYVEKLERRLGVRGE